MTVQPSPRELRFLKREVFGAAKNNQPHVIRNCLASLHPDVVKDILHHCFNDEGSLSTPLTIAAWNGHLEVVELLVNKFNVDVNQEVPCCFEMHNALISAVSKGHRKIVEVLVKKGCDTSTANREGRTAVYMACLRNDMHVLKYLVENGAQVNDSPYYLKSACVNRNMEMAEYLLSKGADPNRPTDTGKTALHEAARYDLPDIITLLLLHGARSVKDTLGLSPLVEAALNASSNALKVLLESADVSELDRIEGLELLGAELASRNADDEAFMYVKQAMAERYKNPSAVLLKPHCPLPMLGNVHESQTLEELQARQSDQHLFRLECLAIFSRILGPGDMNTIHNFIRYSEKLKSTGRNDEATALYLHGMKAAVKYYSSPRDAIYAMQLLGIKLFELLQHGVLTIFSELEECLESALNMLEKEKLRYFDILANSHIWLQHILLALKTARGQEEGRRLQRLVNRFVSLTLGSTVLHTAVSFSLRRAGYQGNDLPYDSLVPFLLQCGANVHAKDDDKNTPLHIVAGLSSSVPDSDQISRTAKALLDAGALVGVQNKEDQTALDLAAPMLAAELRELYPESLKSLAATAVVNCNIYYVGEVPEHLAEFIEKH